MTALYERYRDDVFVYCQRRLRNREEAEDATQATFLKALTGLRNGAVPQVENAWLFTIAKRVVLTRLEVTNRLRGLETTAEIEAVADNRGGAPGSDEMDDLWKAVAALPETSRRAFLMREWQGMPYDEIADALGLDKSHVGVMLLRARRRVVATVQTSRSRARAVLNVGSLSGLVRRLADLFAGNASHLLLAATAIATPVGVAAAQGGHPSSPSQRLVSASASSEFGAPTLVRASVVGAPASPRPFMVVRASRSSGRGETVTVSTGGGDPFRPPESPAASSPAAPALGPGAAAPPAGGAPTTATPSVAAEARPVALTAPVDGKDLASTTDGANATSGAKPASSPGQSRGKYQGPPARVPPGGRAHVASRGSGNASHASELAAARKQAVRLANGAPVPGSQASRGDVPPGQRARIAARALDDPEPGVRNGDGRGAVGPGGPSSARAPSFDGEEHGSAHGPSEPGRQGAPVDPSSSAAAAPGSVKKNEDDAAAAVAADPAGVAVVDEPVPGNAHGSQAGNGQDAGAATADAVVDPADPPVPPGPPSTVDVPVPALAAAGDPAVVADAAPGNDQKPSPVVVPVVAAAVPGNGPASASGNGQAAAPDAAPVLLEAAAPVAPPAAPAQPPATSAQPAPASVPPATPVGAPGPPAKKPPKN